jgi:hypothetical protein
MIAKHNRRLFLRGLGGAVVAAPFLGSVAERVAKGQDTPIPTPRRLILMFTHYGCLTNRWFPVNSHGPLTAEDLTGTSLEALAPHVGKLLMPRGIRAMNEWTEDLSLGQGNDYLTQVCGSYFTCVPVTPHSDDPFDLACTPCRFEAMPIGPSLDHVCAQQLSSDGFPLLMQLGLMDTSPVSSVSYSAREQLFSGFGSATEVFSSLTGLFADGEPVSADSYQALRKRSVVDLVKDDLAALERHDMSASDKRKLAAWKELLHETGSVVASAQCNADLVATLGLTEANLLAYDNAPLETDKLASIISGEMDGADLFSNLAVLSALCDPSRPVLLKYPAQHVFRALGLESDSRTVTGRIGRPGLIGPCVEGANEMVLTIDRYHARKFAYLVRQLDGIDEGDGTLLDNSAAVWFQQVSDGAALNLNNMPILQAGSCGGYFKTGYAINVDDGSADLHRGNSEAPCAVDGEIADIKQPGTPVEFGNAPINKYYCNLMNAIGVKAGSDGFPVVGGTEEVTHYGMYDDTRDFASGGTNPPVINNPGEFIELRSSS